MYYARNVLQRIRIIYFQVGFTIIILYSTYVRTRRGETRFRRRVPQTFPAATTLCTVVVATVYACVDRVRPQRYIVVINYYCCYYIVFLVTKTSAYQFLSLIILLLL